MNVDINKKYKTRGGRTVRILATDLNGDYPVAGSLTKEDGKDYLFRWRLNGRFIYNTESDSDLVEVPKQLEIKVWNYGAENHYSIRTETSGPSTGPYYKGSFKVDLPSEFGDVK